MTRHQSPRRSMGAPNPDPDRGSGIISWLLIFMALAAFAPCVLLPELRSYQAMRMAEEAQQHRMDSLQRTVDREHRLLEALRSDPAVIARAAQRELRFKKPGDRQVRVSVTPTGKASDEALAPKPVLAPRPLSRAAAYLPKYNYDRIFCDDRARLVIMAMSVALMLLAVCLPRRSESSR